MKTYAPKSSWKSSLARSKSAADKSKPLAQAKQESGTQSEAASERGWGTMTDNVMRAYRPERGNLDQGIVLQPKPNRAFSDEPLALSAPYPYSNSKQNIQKKDKGNENNTGLSDRLKTGLEQLSGLDLSDIRVHRNSTRPAQLQALAYTQGQNIYVAPGQEKYLPHEGWHAVQQMKSLVKPTKQVEGIAINDDTTLEHEADVMGARALKVGRHTRLLSKTTVKNNDFKSVQQKASERIEPHNSFSSVVQRVLEGEQAKVAFRQVIAKADEWGQRWQVPQANEFTDEKMNQYAAAATQDFQALATMGRRIIEEKDDVFAGWRRGEKVVENIFKKFYQSMSKSSENWQKHLAKVYRDLTEGQVLNEFNHRGAYLALRYLTAQYRLSGPGEQLIGVHVNRGLPSKRKGLAETAIASAYE